MRTHPQRADEVVIAIDVGGTGVKCALVGPDHRPRHTERHPTGRARGPEAVVESLLAIGAGLAGTAQAKGWHPVAAGLVVPGVVDEACGTAVYSANLGFRDVRLRDVFRAHLGLPAALGHDVRAGGLAEARLGAGQGADHVLFVPVGTGIAAAYVRHGRVAAGAHGAAGELGHVVIRPDGPECGCGQQGCLEAIASASAIERGYLAHSGLAANAAEIAARLGRDPAADRTWAAAIDALAGGLLTAQALFDPELVIIGGGLAEAGAALLDPLRSSLAAKRTFHRLPEIVQAQLGDEAGCLGAALLALQLLGG